MTVQKHHRMIFILAVATSLLFTACSGLEPATIKPSSDAILVWPPEPDAPRIKYIGSLSRPKDLGITKGFLSMLSDVALGKEDNGMVLPMAVVENAQKQLYIADPGVKAVHRFDKKQGRYVSIKRKGGKDFESPVSLAADGKGNVYVTDSELAKVFIIGVNDTEALPLEVDDDFNRPTGIAVDTKTGWIYVVDTGLHTVSIFNPDLSLLKKFGHRGSKDGEFNFPTYIWLNQDEQLLVTDSLNFRVQRFDRYGTYIGQFGTPGNALGSLSRPKGVAEDSHGHVYVVDSLFHNVQLFDKSGSLLMHFGKQGIKPGEFWLPVGVFIGDDDIIYLCDSYNQRVQIFQYVGDEQ